MNPGLSVTVPYRSMRFAGAQITTQIFPALVSSTSILGYIHILYMYIHIYIYMLPPPPEGSTILAVSENWIQHLAVSEDSEANEAYMKRVVNECDAC